MAGTLIGQSRPILADHRLRPDDAYLLHTGNRRQTGEKLAAFVDGAVDHAFGEAYLDGFGNRTRMAFGGIQREVTEAQGRQGRQHDNQRRQNGDKKDQYLDFEFHRRSPLRLAVTVANHVFAVGIFSGAHGLA